MALPRLSPDVLRGQDRRPADAYGRNDLLEDLRVLTHPVEALSLLPRTATGRVSVKLCWSAAWAYALLPSRDGGLTKLWGSLLVGSLSALVLGLIGLFSSPVRVGLTAWMVAFGGVALYVQGCLMARRIGLLMANRFTEADLPKVQ